MLSHSFVSNCDPMDCRLPGSTVCGISQVRIQEWVAFPSPGDLPNPGIEPASPALAGGFFTIEPPGKPISVCRHPKDNPEMCIIETSTRQECWEETGKRSYLKRNHLIRTLKGSKRNGKRKKE